MVRNWKSTFGAVLVGIGYAIATCSPASAQVDWVTQLGAPATPATLFGQNLALASDGAISSAAIVNTGEGNRVRVSRVSATGTVQWVRWATASSLKTPTALWAHPDGSTTIAYQELVNSSSWCFENFSSTGDSRYRDCPTYAGVYQSDFRVTLATDGDFYFAYGYQRTIKKISPLGVARWSSTYATGPYGSPTAQGVDSVGNYFEATGTRLVHWNAADGARLSDAVLSGVGGIVTASAPLARANRETVFIRSQTATSNAMTATVSRNSPTGLLTWSRDFVFAGYGPSDSLRLAAGDNDSVYVIRTAVTDGDSHVAKISATGVVLWQKHYARVRRIIDNGNALTAIRTDVSVATNSNDSFLFPISGSDGTLGAPMIYSRADVFAPSEWFATGAGALATYSGGNPFAPFATFPAALSATSYFVGYASVSNRWQVTADMKPTTSVSQSDCLMPRMSSSSPSSWWTRVQAALQAPTTAAWTKVDATTGTALAQTMPAARGCGFPVTADGGQIIVNGNAGDRVRKVDASGNQVWQTPSVLMPTQAASQPVLSLASNGEASYAVGSLIGRTTAAGASAFEIDTNRPNPRYVATDSANNVWVVSGYSSSDGYVSKVSPTGALLWSAAVDVPSCSDAIMAARLTASDEMLVATQSCGEGRLFKLNAAGQVAWQRLVSGTAQRPSVMLSALHVDTAGNIYAGGCMSNGNPTNAGANGFSIISSWTSAGTERWTAITDLISSASECVSSIAVDPSGIVFAASSSSGATRAPVLWSLSASGVERWRHSGVLSSPFAASTELAVDVNGKLLALGEAPPTALGNREASLRRISVAAIGPPLLLKFLEVPTTSVGYRTPFTVRIGLRTAADAVATANAPVVISLALLTGNGKLDGSRSCTIAVGASECTISDARYDAVESGVTLTANSDGFASIVSSSLMFALADTATTIAALTPGPYDAFTVVRFRATLDAPLPPAGQSVAGYLSGPSSYSGYPTVFNCQQHSNAGSLPFNECDVLLHVELMPLHAYFTGSTTYNGSTAVSLAVSIAKVAPTLQVVPDPANTYVNGDRMRFRVSFFSPNGYNVSRFADRSLIVGGACDSWVMTGTPLDKFSGDYWICEIPQAPLGTGSVTFSFLGNANLLPSGPVTLSVTVNAGAVVRGYVNNIPSGFSICSSTPNVSCQIMTYTYANEWQCVGPVGMSGSIFFMPGLNSGPYYVDAAPLQFRNVTGVARDSTYLSATYSASTCSLDVDGDGARMAITDGVLILRRIFGLTGVALTNSATHSCVPRSAAAIASAINLSAYDVDGDGQTLPETDGLLLLRAMLGFRGDALVVGVTGANATRKTYGDIRSFLANTCSFYLN